MKRARPRRPGGRSRRAAEREVRGAIHRLAAPDERGAEERAWRVLGADRPEHLPAGQRRGSLRRHALQAGLAVGLLALVVSPAGAAVRHWVADRVDPGIDRAEPVLGSLPGGGSLLVQSRQGPWVIRPDGAKRLLGEYGESTWSPHGLFVAAASRHQLAAIAADGTVRWTIGGRGRVRLPSWNGPDGFRISYLDGHSLRVVDGDGGDDRLLARRAAAVAAAWKPGPEHLVAYARPDGRVVAVGADDGTRRFATAPGARPLSLQWSSTAKRLMVVRPGRIELLDDSGVVRWRDDAPAGSRFLAARLSPAGDQVAAIVARRGGSSLILDLPETAVGTQAAPVDGPAAAAGRTHGDRAPGARTLFSGPGRFSSVDWSPNGHWLLLAWPAADQWLFLDPEGKGRARIHAVANVAAQFAPGTSDPIAVPFPRVAGWCCAR